jgi:hypothetical protein
MMLRVAKLTCKEIVTSVRKVDAVLGVEII